MSVGLGLAFPAFSSTALIRVGDRDAGVASALVNTTQQIGGSLGTALLNTLAATATASYIVAHGPAASQAGVVHGFAVAFAVGAAFLALGAIASAVLISAGPAEVARARGCDRRRGGLTGDLRAVRRAAEPGSAAADRHRGPAALGRCRRRPGGHSGRRADALRGHLRRGQRRRPVPLPLLAPGCRRPLRPTGGGGQQRRGRLAHAPAQAARRGVRRPKGAAAPALRAARMSPPICATSSWRSRPRPTSSARKARSISSRSAGAWGTGSDWLLGAAPAPPRASVSRPWSGPSTGSTVRSPSCTPTPWRTWPPPTRPRSAPRWPRSRRSSDSGWRTSVPTATRTRRGVGAGTRCSTGSSTRGPMRNRSEAGTGICLDITLVHVASMSNLFAALGWHLVDLMEHPDEAAPGASRRLGLAETCALESTRMAQRSIMARFTLAPFTIDLEEGPLGFPSGMTVATLLPLTNRSAAPGLDRVGSGALEPPEVADAERIGCPRARDGVRTRRALVPGPSLLLGRHDADVASPPVDRFGGSLPGPASRAGAGADRRRRASGRARFAPVTGDGEDAVRPDARAGASDARG